MHVRRMNRRNGAFTLVEILIVVVILGILAAIVVPQFTSAANEARDGNLATQQSTITNQLELWAARNNGVYPDLETDGWDDMVEENYFKSAPVNPFTGTSSVENSTDPEDAATAAAPTQGAVGWYYNSATGVIRGNTFPADD